MKIYINNFALNCALGSSTEEVRRTLFSSGNKDNSIPYTLVDGKKTRIFPIQKSLPSLPEELSRFDSRNNRLTYSCLLELRDEIDLVIEKYGAKKVGVVFGTSTSGIEEGISALRNGAGTLDKNYSYELQELGSTSLFIKEYLELKSVAYTISTACSSGARSFIEGSDLIRSGVCDAVIVGGTDTLNDLTLNGFHSLEAISEGRSNPFSVNREGINIGEGSGVFIISGVKGPVELCGMGESTDAYHISSPDPSGAGALIAMKMALENSELSPSEIGYINLHGTGTPKNDSMEAKAVNELFPELLKASSTKPMTGHTLGAAGAVELAICALSLREGKLPEHLYDGDYDPELPKLNISREVGRDELRYCMSNSYAFGGNNASIIIGKTTNES